MQTDASDSIPTALPIAGRRSSLRAVSRGCALLALAIAGVVLFGWCTRIQLLTSGLPSLATMKVNTALCIALLAAAVWLVDRDRRVLRSLAATCLLICIVVGLLTSIEYLAGVDFHIDNAVFVDLAAPVYPGRMAPTTIFCFCVQAIALLCLARHRLTAVAQAALAFIVIVSLATLGGYLYGAPKMMAHAPYPVVAINTAAAIVLLSIAGLLVRPGEGAMQVVTAATTGGWLARRLIPTALAVPLLAGLSVVSGQRANLYGTEFSIALIVAINIAVLVGSVWWVSMLLNTADLARRANEAEALEAERRFREIANAMPQIVWTAAADGTIDYFNDRWYAFTGVATGEVGNRSWKANVHPDDAARCDVAYTLSLTTGEPYEVECRLKDHRAGEYRWHLERALPARDEHGAIVRWYGTSTEIHEQKQAVEQRRVALDAERDARTEAERQSQLKDNFLATLSHELRTPLNAIFGWSTLLSRRNDLDADTREGVEVISRNAQSQKQLIEDLLDMSRIISGKLRLDVQPVDLAAVVSAAVETVRPTADTKHIRVSVSLDPGSLSINGDPNRLQQVLWNLITNAVKFTPKGGRVAVRLERVDSQMKLCVTDSGEGISAEFLPFVFDRFRQADGTTTRRHGGLGLGLNIARQLVELHGGDVSVESAGLGQGATFTVTLPIAAVRPTPTPTAEPMHSSADTKPVEADAISLTGLKVLVVDDEPDARGLVKRLLEERGAAAASAGSASEAMALLETQAFDVVVSDIGMPGEDGYALIAQLRALPADRGGNLPAIALTAYARAEDRTKAMRAGFTTHLVKPVEPTELVARIAGVTGKLINAA